MKADEERPEAITALGRSFFIIRRPIAIDFDRAYDEFVKEHTEKRSGERKGRLNRGLGYAEKLFLQNVWWPLMGSFEHLHPEYEVYDWNRMSQFLDFAFATNHAKFGLEIDGFQSHIKDMDREKHSYSLNRDNFLTGIGWKMLHFSFDDVQKHPDVCQMLLQLALAPYLIRSHIALVPTLPASEREVLRLAWSLGRPIRPSDVKTALLINFRTARNRLQALSSKGLLEPLPTENGVRQYKLTEQAASQLFHIAQ